ncbi:MAG: SRPBCC family protein [Deltaproteobacteria bacterium]|jgi:uncharacterized protein YndB with AHSA1/START domain|nr:SRPBCC family protein [Deltaproteobacteria bacterium]
MSEHSIAYGSFTIERFYPAKPQKVFRAHSDAAIKRRWFAEGEGWDIETYELDFRVGGTESSSFRFRGGDLITFDGTYLDIVSDARVILAYGMTVAGRRISASLASTEFKPEGSGTRLVFTEQGAYLDGQDQIPQREEGTRELFEALARELEKL